jgi:hypothetical protein
MGSYQISSSEIVFYQVRLEVQAYSLVFLAKIAIFAIFAIFGRPDGPVWTRQRTFVARIINYQKLMSSNVSCLVRLRLGLEGAPP